MLAIDPPRKQRPRLTGPQGQLRTSLEEKIPAAGLLPARQIRAQGNSLRPKGSHTVRKYTFKQWGTKSFAVGKMEASLFPDPGIPLLMGKNWTEKGGDTCSVAVFLFRIATCRFGLGCSLFLGLVCFKVGVWAQQTPVWPSPPACLSVWVTPLTHPHIRCPAFVSVSECVCATLSLKSTAHSASPPYQSLNNSSHNALYYFQTFPPLFSCHCLYTKIQLWSWTESCISLHYAKVNVNVVQPSSLKPLEVIRSKHTRTSNYWFI